MELLFGEKVSGNPFSWRLFAATNQYLSHFLNSFTSEEEDQEVTSCPRTMRRLFNNNDYSTPIIDNDSRPTMASVLLLLLLAVILVEEEGGDYSRPIMATVLPPR